MSRIEELNDANIRVVYNDAGDIESLIDNKGRALNIPLVSKDVTGGIGILGPNGKQIGGDGSPHAFTSRELTDADNGLIHICASAQVATVNIGRVAGFVPFFKGPISFNGTATVTDVRTTGAANPWCALTQTGVDTYDVVGTKA